MTSSLLRSFSLLVLALAVGCSGDATYTPDAGEDSFDASTTADASATDDASTVEDASRSDDASASDDAATSTDGGSAVDACMPPRCPPIPVGCDVIGGTACTCGTIVCPAEPCSPACTRGQYCMYESMCGGSGACAMRPDACPDVVDPVCGCDGVTYSNACEAAAAGQSVASDDACERPTDCRTEGCEAGSTCQGCRGPGGGRWLCLPDGVVC